VRSNCAVSLWPLRCCSRARLIDGGGPATAPPPGPCWPTSARPSSGPGPFGLIGCGLRLRLHPRSGAGRGIGGNRHQPAVARRRERRRSSTWLLVVKGCLPEDPACGGPLASARKRDPTARWCSPGGCSNPQGAAAVRRRSCVFFLAFGGFTAVLVLLFQTRLRWGPGLSATAYLVVGRGRPPGPGRLIVRLLQRFREGRLNPGPRAWPV